MDNVTKKLALALALGGCAGPEATQPPMTTKDPVEVEASISRDLTRLNGLELVAVDHLVLRLPAEATNCYGGICPGWEERVRDERAQQASRLAGLVEIAARIAPTQGLTGRPTSEAGAAVQALDALRIVEVGSLLQVEPRNNGACYGLPCPGDREAADRENARRVGAAFAIADEATKSRL
jgi:hypothetical protein